MAIIYMATCRNTGKSYIGQTIQTLNKREIKHVSDSKYLKRSAFHAAIVKYGRENFTWETLYHAPEADLNRLETLCINRYNTLSPNGYNLREGGHNGRLSQESIEKIRVAQTGKPGPNKGKPVSKETRQKISNSLKGNVPWNKGKKGSVAWNKGISPSEEQRRKQSKTMKGRTPWNKGKKWKKKNPNQLTLFED